MSKLQVIKEYKGIGIYIPIERGKSKNLNFTLKKEKKKS